MESYLQKLGEGKISDSEWQNIKLFLIDNQPVISLITLFRSIKSALDGNFVSNIDNILYYIQPYIQKQLDAQNNIFPYPLLYPDIVDISRQLDNVSPASSIRFYLFVNNTGLYERSKKAFEVHSNRIIGRTVRLGKYSPSVMNSIVKNIVRLTKYNIIIDLKRVNGHINYHAIYNSIYEHIFMFCDEIEDAIHLSEVLNSLKLLFMEVKIYNSCPHLSFMGPREYDREKNLLIRLMENEKTRDFYHTVKGLFDGFNFAKRA